MDNDLKGYESGLRYCPGFFQMRLRRPMKNLRQDSQSPGQDVNPETLGNESRVLTTEPQCLVTLKKNKLA
jgi:hypothetical protein